MRALLVCPWSASRASRSKLVLTSLTSRFLPFTQEPWRFQRLPSSCRHYPWFLPLTRAPPTLLFKPFLSLFVVAVVHETCLRDQDQPVTQASIILAIIALSLSLLALIVIYSQSPMVSILCVIVLAIVVYTALRLAPR
jgi:hypothetical protein